MIMDKLTEYILNNRAIQAYVSDAISNNLSHAYLVTAEDSDTVSTALREMTKACLCPNHGCNSCETCLRIDHGNHSNVHLYSEYSVDVIKSIISATFVQSPEDGATIFLLDNFNGVSVSAQNKLLKTLEEPSENILIIIGTTNDTAILKTIMSRVKKITLNVWCSERIKAELISLGVDEKTAEFASAICPDSLSKAKEIINDDGAKNAYDEIYQMLTEIERSSEIPRFLGVFGDNNAEINLRLDILESIIAKALRDIANEISTAINQKFNVAALSNIIECIVDAKAKAKVNVNAINITNTLLMDILEIRYKTAK